MKEQVILDWATLLFRWTHVIAGMAWVGESFYFVALDLGLNLTADRGSGISGEAWQVHGGGFYHVQKYGLAPSNLPEHLTWFKWQAYWTWIFGFALLVA